ncbi:MAG: type II toxin-antitoxin system RelB/DinJ family antitoxin [Propionibacteriaceae bacterium]|nr:type II toxin-antitoxin system RelB/DinJ family antitoxin [Propionibacteriaceae bacterium]
MSTTLTVRMDTELKDKFAAIAASVGLDAPTVVRMLAVQTVRNRAIPLSLSAPDAPEEADLTWLDAARADWGSWRKQISERS